MFHTTRSLLCLALLLALGACQQQSSSPASAPAAKATPGTTPATTAASVGVPECDNYLDKYVACVSSKAPEAERATLIQSIDATRAAWRTASATPGGREGLATACKQAYDASKAAMNQYGCSDF